MEILAPAGVLRLHAMQEVVNSGIQCVVLRTGTTNVDESSAVQSGVSLGIQGSKPSNASISKSQVPFRPQVFSLNIDRINLLYSRRNCIQTACHSRGLLAPLARIDEPAWVPCVSCKAAVLP